MRYLVTIFIFLVSLKSYADYEPTPLPELVIDSELIIHGKIIDIDSETFTIDIIEKIKGDFNNQIIQIQKFEDWECANRLPKYQIGQEELIFLIQHKETKEWIIMGAGIEEELFIQNDSVIYEDIYYDSKSGCSEINYSGYNVCGWKFSLQEFKTDIKLYLKDFPEILTTYKKSFKITNLRKENRAYTRMMYESFDYIALRRNE